MQLLSQVDTIGKKIQRIETVNEQLTHEIALLKRHKFAKRSEQLSPDQGSLLDDLLDTDIAAIEVELKAVNPPAAPAEPRQQPKRAPLPPQFPRTVIRHEPENTQCACGCQLQRVGEDVSEKLDYTPGVFKVEQHVRGKWVCREYEALVKRSSLPSGTAKLHSSVLPIWRKSWPTIPGKPPRPQCWGQYSAALVCDRFKVFEKPSSGMVRVENFLPRVDLVDRLCWTPIHSSRTSCCR